MPTEERKEIISAAQSIADGLTDLLTWAHESGGDMRDQHVQQGRDLLANGIEAMLVILIRR